MLKSFFTSADPQTGTQNPERLIETIKEVYPINDNQF